MKKSQVSNEVVMAVTVLFDFLGPLRPVGTPRPPVRLLMESGEER